MTKSISFAWIVAHANYEGDGCLIWPFSTCKGYPTLGLNRKIVRASRVMCEMVNGPPPSRSHEAAHLCGRGHEACMHPKHIVWKTKSANQLDRRRHGTNRTNRTGRRGALTADQVKAIRAATGTNMSIAKAFGVSEHTVMRVRNRETYAKVA